MTAEEFDLIYKDRGGRLKGDYPWHIREALRNLRNIVDFYQKNIAGYPLAYVDVIENSEFNACVTKAGGAYYIGIYAGAIDITFNVFYRMLASNRLFPHIGDILKESDTVKEEEATTMNMFHLDPYRYVFPKDPVRQNFAEFLIINLLTFLVLHEYGHVVNGHCGYRETLGTKVQIDQKYSEGLLNYLDWQTLEMDADSFATNKGVELLHLRFEGVFPISEALKSTFTNWLSALQVWFFSIYTFYRIFGYCNDIKNFKSGEHHPPSLRATMIMGNVWSIFQQKAYNRNILNEIAPMCLKSIYDVEDAFVEISKQKGDLRPLMFSVTEQAQAHSKFLMRNWNQVRPLIEPFAYAKLPPIVD